MKNALFGLCIEGKIQPNSVSCPSSAAPLSVAENGNRVSYGYKVHDTLDVNCEVISIPGCGVKRQINTVKNSGENTVLLDYFSSGTIVLPTGKLAWDDENKYRVHFCQGCWQGEGQWQSATLDRLGVTNVSFIRTWRAKSFSSTGSWSTNTYFPTFFIEDLECGKTYYFEIEAAGGWNLDIGICDRDGKQTVYVAMDSANQWNDGWCYPLKSGESYTALPCAYGVVDGDIDDAVHELTVYRRAISLTSGGTPAPLVFNDYMGALWAKPTDARLIPIIDKAAELGAEYFCIDDGWFSSPDAEYNKANGLGLGKWSQYDDRFGDYGLDGILDYIKSKGMKPGLWLEIEAFMTTTENADIDDSCILKRNGLPIEAPRTFIDLRNPKAAAYIESVFDNLYSKGVRYIKNDYNHSTGIGCDCENGCFSHGLREITEALYALIDKIKAKYPDMYIENCGSGSQRADGGILRHFDLASVSDQMEYEKNPSIVTGTLAVNLPEKCGIWCYPNLIPVDDFNKCADNLSAFYNEDYINTHKDGEQTIFNVVTSLVGSMYMSAHPEYCDSENFRLYREGAETYKQLRNFICKSFPVFPSGFFRISDRGIFSAGLINEEKTKLLLAVWNIKDADNLSGAVDLSKWSGKDTEIRMLYPEKGYEIPIGFDPINGLFTFTLPTENSARLFEIDL